MKLQRNIILDTDSYKNDHGRMLPQNTTKMFSTIIFRKPNKYAGFTKFLGIQYFIKEYLLEPITLEMINEAEIEITQQGYVFDRKRWEYILKKHNGFMPLDIKSVEEGMIIPVGVPAVTIENTDNNCAWLVSYIETSIQRTIWKMTTVASISKNLHDYLSEIMFKHEGHKNVDYHLHNFGARGADSFEVDIMSGISHASGGFRGSDSLQTNRAIKYYYNTKIPYLSSVIASEHSVMCANSDPETKDDFKAVVKMIDLLEENIENNLGTPIVSIVGDTYDIYRMAEEYIGIRLKHRIMELGAKGGRVVLRPDSGEPKKICLEVINILMDKFGYSINKNGYKVLPEYIRVLQGDGINQDSIREIVCELENNNISLDNLLFGMGGGLTHEAGRDEFSCSMKATAIEYDGKWHDLQKDPITDIAKRSPKGRVTTYLNHNKEIYYERVELKEFNPELIDLMSTIFKNGKLLKEYTFEDVLDHNKK